MMSRSNNKDVLIAISLQSNIWNKIKSLDDLEKIFNSKDAKELLKIEDFYTDLVSDLYEEDYKEKFSDSIEDKNDEGLAYTPKNYLMILNNNKSSELLKKAIIVLLKAEPICKNLYRNIK